MTYTAQAELETSTFITADMYNQFPENIVDHNTRLNALYSGNGTVANVTIGMIFMFWGNAGTLEDKWHLCDGMGGTPDLRDVFIVGAGSTYTPATTGGLNTHNHEMGDTSTSSSHNHSASFTTSSASSSNTQALGSTAISQSHNHYVNSNVSSGGSHDHSIPDTGNANTGLPPYNAVKFIMRIK
jgi:hypothetical protein